MFKKPTIILKRCIGIIAAVIPFLIVILLCIYKWRIAGGRLSSIGYILFGLGGLISFANLYFSFLRYPLHRLFGGTKENYRYVSGIPLFGVLSTIGLIFIPQLLWLNILTFIFLIIDTGGIPWIVLAVWKDNSFWDIDTYKSNKQDIIVNRIHRKS